MYIGSKDLLGCARKEEKMSSKDVQIVIVK